jgi:hypothetical protein
MKTIYSPLIFALFCAFAFSSCISPVMSRYDSARTIGKGKMELSGGYSRYEPRADESRFQADSYASIGGRFGYGISEQVDGKLRFEHLLIDEEIGVDINYLELSGKIRLTDITSPVQFATTQSLDGYFVDTPDGPTQMAVSYSLVNTISYQADQVFEAALSTQLRYFLDLDPELFDLDFGNVDFSVYENLNRVLLEAGLDVELNLGFSTDFDRWAVRPFAGMGIGYVEPGEVGIYKIVSWNYGVGFNYFFGD